MIGTADRTRVAVGGPGKAYLTFQPKQISGAQPQQQVPVWWLIDVNEIVGGGNS